MRKIKRNAYLSLCTMAILVLNIACETEQVAKTDTQNSLEGLSPEVISKIKEVEKLLGKEDYELVGYKNAKELVLDGAEVVKYTPTEEDNKRWAELVKKEAEKSANITNKASSSRLNINQLRELGWGDEAIKDAYIPDFNRRPDGFSIVGYASGGGRGDLPDRYGWWADVTIGEPTLNVTVPLGYIRRQRYRVTGFNYDRNLSDVVELAINVTEGKEKNWNVTGNVSFTVGGNVGIPFVASGMVSATVGISAGGGGSESTSTSVNRRYEASVPAYSYRVIDFLQDRKAAEADYNLPVDITGRIALNYGRRVGGHFFWGIDASRLQRGNHSMFGKQKFLERLNSGVFVAHRAKRIGT
jgi:hypothetical protein